MPVGGGAVLRCACGNHSEARSGGHPRLEVAMRKVTILMGILFLGCLGPGYDSGWESGGGGGFAFTYAATACDPNYDTFDDIWWIAAATSSQATSVQVAAASRSIALEFDPSDGFWYGSVWADDLDSDCDTLGAITWTFTASGQNGETANYGPITGTLYTGS